MKNLLTELLGNRESRASFAAIARERPELLAPYVWKANAIPRDLPDAPWLHLGCGENVLDGFVNLDFLPHDARVGEWDFLQPWPEAWPRAARGAFSEDTLEHFHLAEQLYILCEVNRLLEAHGVFRVLMPSLERLLAYCRDFQPRAGEFLYQTFGVETEADAINMGMRFSGHRWLHDDRSLAHLASEAGFDAIRTSCAESTEPFLSGRNLRSEDGTAAFAHDLRKVRAIHRDTLVPSERHQLERVDTLDGGIEVLRVGSDQAALRFELPEPVELASIACINVRSAAIGSLREHSLKRFEVKGDFGAGRWALDETLKSHAAMNVMAPAQLRIASGEKGGHLREIALVPGRTGDYVTSGVLEIYRA